MEKNELLNFLLQNMKVTVEQDNLIAKRNKGQSLVDFPSDCCVIDIETTGLDYSYDEIIEISAIKVVDGNFTDTFSQLIKPSEPVSDFITQLTGITNEMLSDKPSIQDVLPGFIDFVGKSLLVGYNVNFDINFLYDAVKSHLHIEFNNDFVDVLRIARRIHPELPGRKLKDMISFYQLDDIGSHRAEADSIQTYRVLLKLREDIIAQYGSFDEFKTSMKTKKSSSHHGVKASEITSDEASHIPDHPLYGKVCVFTGTLEKMPRREAMQLVSNIGGLLGDSVTKKTNYLILGNNDYCKSIKDGKSTKQKKAEQLILDGQDLQILSENAFYSMFEFE